MIVSKYAFFDVIQAGMFGDAEVRLDPSRVASTIASGIGFLGAGMIFVHKNTITGLTTAAGVWATSGVGMAIGAGMYVIGIAATLIIILVQILLHLNIARPKLPNMKKLTVSGVTAAEYQKYMTSQFEAIGAKVYDVAVEKNKDGETRNYTFIMDLPNHLTEDEVFSLIDYPCKILTSKT